MKKTKRHPRSSAAKGPVTLLQTELRSLRRELRATLRAYSARLEISLAQTTAVVANSKSADELSRDELHKIRDLTQIVRNRKLKPEKGRRKDLRKLDCLIEDLNSAALNGHAD
ncbi:hypothetical protein BH20VER1_BH20VER1_06860 [soil metagenome]